MNVALVGYFGYDNCGDEAISQSLLYLIKTYYKPIHTVLFTSEKMVSMPPRSGVTSLNRKSIPSLVAGIRMSDVIVFSGGSLFQDRTSFSNLLYYLGVLILARVLGKKVFLYAQGVEPYRFWVSRVLVKYFFYFAQEISVRDLSSQSYLKDTLKLKKRIRMVVDSALLIAPHIKNNKYRNKIGISLLTFKGIDLRVAVEGINLFLEKESLSAIFFPFNPKDEMVYDEYFSDSSVTFYTQPESIAEMMGDISQLDLMIGMRLHSCIFSANVSVPFVGVDFFGKVSSFAHDVKQPVVKWEDVNCDMLYNILSETYKKRESFKNILSYQVESFRENSKDQLFTNILTKYEKE
jgi:polysaccharide pyruvyl transferase CsaB